MVEITECNPKVTMTIDSDGSKYYRNELGQFHRDGGPASEWPDGTKFWFRHGEIHRDDGPAVEWSHGGKEWYQNGKHHRIDGPATEWPDGRKWWSINGKPLSEQQFKLHHNDLNLKS